MSKKIKSVITLILVAALVACTGPGAGAPAATPAAPTAPATPAAPPAAAPVAPEPASWAEENLFVDRDIEELYALALEEGHLIVYSISSRMPAVAESFMERFPGIEVEIFHLRINELIERFEREYDAGIRNADVLHTKDQDGAIWFEFVKEGKLHNYHPAGIIDFIDPAHLEISLPFHIMLNQWFFNTEAFPDGPPISSWWDVTRPEWNGRIMIRNPLACIDTLSTFAAIVKHADEMAEDYERVFGQPITLDPGSPTAGHEFLRRLLASNPIFVTSSGEIVTGVGTPGQTNPPIGFAASSGFRRTIERGYVLHYVNITPATGLPMANTIYVTDEAPNPNAARLFVYWILGGTDGQGEGFVPFNTIGAWPVRSDQVPEEGSTPFEDLNVWDLDVEWMYHNIHNVADFWISLL